MVLTDIRSLALAALSFTICSIFVFIPPLRPSTLDFAWRRLKEPSLVSVQAVFSSQRKPPFKVALASTFGAWHFDVMVPIARTFENVLGSQESCRLYVETPYHLGDFGFDEVVNSTGIYHGDQFKHTDLATDMYRVDLFPSDPGAMIDLVVFGTCEYDMEYWSSDLLTAWDARPSDRKFTIVCVVHEVSDHRSFRDISEWSIRGAVRYLTIADHVSDNLMEHLDSISDGHDSADYYSLAEYAKVDVHAPVIPLPDTPKPAPGSRRLVNATVQGLMHVERRDYDGILHDLWEALEEDPYLWGYLPAAPGTKEFLPDPHSPDQPFQLHFIGSQGWVDIPDELKHVVKFHRDLSYMQYYDVMKTMDVVLPAFKNEHYFDEKASSTVAMAIQCNVPILATHRFRASYRYASDDRILITRPAALREVHALQILRGASVPLSRKRSTNKPLSELLKQYLPKMQGHSRDAFERDVRKMVRLGWERSNEEFAAFKKELWRKNEEVARRMVEGR